MQSTFYTAPNSHHFQLPWKSPEPNFTARKSIPQKPQNRFKTLTLTNSLSIPLGYESEEGIDHVPPVPGPRPRPEPASPGRLPVVIRRSDEVCRYFWDGSRLQLVCVDGSGSSFSFDFDDGFRKMFRLCGSAVRDFFIPKQVSENYMDYVKWKLLHRVFSSALQVLATQAMLRAIGIGYSRSLPSAAALNWVLKDGLGRLSRCIYTAGLASAFDTNLKRVRFSTSVMFSLSIGVELLTPVFPQHFLLLASIANIAKQISLASYLATNIGLCLGKNFFCYWIFHHIMCRFNVVTLFKQTAIRRSFAIADNLGEVSAKAQIQTVCFDNLGLLLAAVLNILLKNNQSLQAGLPFVIYPIFSAVDLFGIYQGLKHVHLQTLTKDRLEIILNIWIESGFVPSPAEVSKEEGVDFLWSKGKKNWPIRIGCLNPKDQIPKLSMMAMQYSSGEDYYFICMEIFHKGVKRTKQQGILLCLREGASIADIIMGLLQACYIRKALLVRRSWWESILRVGDALDSVLNEWHKVIEDSKRCAQRDLSLLNEQMLAVGWAAKNILLSTEEQARYSFVDD
ncbi:protein root UVB sensitive 4-like isoform X1 [Castanea sativa]|uniref:protein root UVB sensitive 4-like isoform X1 n=1 Tax=Castanea sativa TaxID=21020 RepID=UPI003F651530